MNSLEPQGVTDLAGLSGKPFDAPQRRILGRIRAPAPELVVEDDLPPVAQEIAERLEVVVRARRTAVENEQRSSAALPEDLVVDPTVGQI